MRNRRRGIILISTLLTLLLLAAVAGGVQARIQANLALFARLERAQYEGLARDALDARLRALLGDLFTGAAPPVAGMNLSGAPFTLSQSGQTFTLMLNDPEGRVDLYLAPEATLALLAPIAPMDRQARAAMIAALPGGARYPSRAATLAQMGLIAESRAALSPLVTTRGENGQLRRAHVPAALTPRLDLLPASAFKTGQATRAEITVLTP